MVARYGNGNSQNVAKTYGNVLIMHIILFPQTGNCGCYGNGNGNSQNVEKNIWIPR